MVLVFEIFAVPNLTPRLGVRVSQRVGSVFEVPVYFMLPLISHANGSDFPVTIAAIILLFTCYVTSNSVSALPPVVRVETAPESDDGYVGWTSLVEIGKRTACATAAVTVYCLRGIIL